jgi:uncharacterized protein (TIGR01777 family)
MTETIAITGASGLLGRALGASLAQGGHRVLRMVRQEAAAGEISWDPAAGRLDPATLEGVDVVIHLSGEPIAQRWTATRMRKIWDSRAQSTDLLARTLARLDRKPRLLVSASAIGVYGDRHNELLTEDSAVATGTSSFLAAVCRVWEESTQPASAAGIRTVQLRMGIVLTPEGGALRVMLPAFRLGVAGRLGSGTQWMSWITLDDLLGAIRHILDVAGLNGPVNLVTPSPVTNDEFTRCLAGILGRPAILPVPAAVLRLAMGQMAEETVLSSQRVVPVRLRESGYRFRHPELEGALRHLLA